MTHKLPPPLAVWLRNGVNVWFRARVRLVGARRFIAVSRIPIPENMPDFVRIEMEDRLAVVTINRPEAMNALNSRLMKELSMAIEHLSMAADVGAIVLTGAGDRAFVAGADIKEMVGLSALEMRSFSEEGRRPEDHGEESGRYRPRESLPAGLDGDAPRRGTRPRDRRVRRRRLDEGQGGGHAGVHREAQALVDRRVIKNRTRTPLAGRSRPVRGPLRRRNCGTRACHRARFGCGRCSCSSSSGTRRSPAILPWSAAP